MRKLIFASAIAMIYFISIAFSLKDYSPGSIAGGGGRSVSSDIVMTTNWGEDNCSIVNLKEGKELAKIKVGLKPYDIKVDSNGRFAYVSCSGSSEIAVIDIQANLVSSYIKTGNSPRDIELSRDCKTAITANAGSDDISVIDLINKKEKYTVKVGNIPYGIALSNDETKVLVTCWGSNEAVIVSLGEKEGKVIKTLKVGSLPYTAIIPSNSNLGLVSSFGSGEVTVIDVNAGEIVEKIKVGKSPWGISASLDGTTAIVANFYSGDMSVLSFKRIGTRQSISETLRYSLLDNMNSERRAKNAIVADNGTWAVLSDLANNQIMKIDIVNKKIVATIDVGKAPYGLAFIPRQE